jgi:two-component SAPR family response regulator
MKNQPSIAKIARPALSAMVPRKRLFGLLNSIHGERAVWISGPPGSGKTVLVASYLEQKKLPCLWYQADADDADISTLFYYLGLAAKHAAPRFREPLPLLTPEYMQGIPTFTRRYFEKLYARLKPPFAVAFDNYQDVPLDSAFHDVIREAISIMPKGISLFLISRGEPPPSFARLRANNKIFAIDWKDMRLTLDESRELVKKRGQGELPQEILAQFHVRTDGWAAGLVLMTEAFKTTGFEPQTTGIATPRELFDYFAGEVIDKLDSETRGFLLISSLLPAMTAHTANQLTRQDNAGRILSTLHGSQMFTEKLSTTNPTYRYHPLFREFLLARMTESLSPEGVLRIQNRAAALLAEAGQIEDAAELYRDAKNWEQFIPLVLGQAQALIIQGRGQTLQGWIEALPQPFLEQVPWLLYWLGVCMLPFSPEGSRDHFERAFALFKARKDAAGLFLSLSGMFDSIAVIFNNFIEYDRLITIFYELYQEFTDYPSVEIETRMTGSLLYAIYARQPRHPDWEYWISRGSELVKSSTDVDARARILLMSALKPLYAGELGKMALILDTFRETMMTRHVTPSALVMLRVLEVNYSWLAAEFDKNREATDEGIAFADATGVHTLDIFILGNGAAGALSIEEMNRADELLKRMRSCLDERAAAWGETFYHNLCAWKYLLQRDLARASLHADLAVKFGIESGAVPNAACQYLINAIVMHELKREDEASEYLSEARRSCAMKTYQTEFGYLLVEAQFAFDRGAEASGLEFLRKAMALGRRHGYMNTFFWAPSVMARLCVKALEAGIETEYVQNLVRKRNLIPNMPPLECENWPWAVKIFTLGWFGIERDGKLIRYSKKVPKKPLEMLKLLVALGGQNVSETRLNDVLWPDADGDSAHRAFNITLIRLRELICLKEAVELRDGCVTLDKRYIWVDAWALEYLLDEASKAQSGASSVPDLFERAISLYKGPFLAGENGAWAVSLRERLKGRVINQVEKLGNSWEEKKMFIKAIDCYRRGLDIDDLMEEFYRRVIFCYVKLGRKAEAFSLYRRCEKVLEAHSIKPSQKTASLLNLLIS